VAFSKLIDQTITDDTVSLWYPKAVIGRYVDKRFATQEVVLPKYPVYVISKGRWETKLTADSLEEMKIPYFFVVEPQEAQAYRDAMVSNKYRFGTLLILPFSNLGQGSIPARNFVWEHAKASGAERHWILDDNISGFYRLHNNLKVPVKTGSTFKAAEDFVDRYSNVAIAGFQYFMFASRKTVMPPFILNTRIYSCILIRNDLTYRWRGRYNEDTDLSIRALKDGWCTVLFNAFLAWKMTTMTMGGGNTESLYKIKEGEKDGRLLMAESLREQHPDIVTITRKWNRWQHQVDYRQFKRNELKLKDGVVIPEGSDNYGMKLEHLTETEMQGATSVPEPTQEQEEELQ